MAIRSTSTQYGSVAILIHWTSALVIILAFAVGFSVANLSAQPVLLLVHIGLGLLAFVLTLLRIVWWFTGDRHPSAPSDQPLWQVRTAQIVHVGLYALLLLMGVSGIVTLILSGAVPILLHGGPIPDLSEIPARIAHGVMSRILLVLFVVHVGAALWHQFVRHDHLLARMGLGRA